MPISCDGQVAISSEPEERKSNVSTVRFYNLKVVSQERPGKYDYFNLSVMVPLIEVRSFLEKAKKPKIFYLRDGILSEWNGTITINTKFPRDFIPMKEQFWTA